MQTVGDRIRIRREQLGISQDELAKKLGYRSRSSVNKIESDARNLTQSKIKAIADALGVSPGYIMGWDIDDSDQWSNRFRESLTALLNSYDSTDANDAGINLNELAEIASSRKPLSLEDCCNACDELGESLDEMTGLREKSPTAASCEADSISMKIAEIIIRLPADKRAEALNYISYLEAQSKNQ